MENVRLFFYWGGKILEGTEFGVSYNISAVKSLVVRRGITLNELIGMLRPCVLEDGVDANLKLKCRMPITLIGPGNFRYTLLSIEDDVALGEVLELPVTLPSLLAVEVYVEVEHAFDHGPKKNSQPGHFTQLLTQSYSTACDGQFSLYNITMSDPQVIQSNNTVQPSYIPKHTPSHSMIDCDRDISSITPHHHHLPNSPPHDNTSNYRGRYDKSVDGELNPINSQYDVLETELDEGLALKPEDNVGDRDKNLDVGPSRQGSEKLELYRVFPFYEQLEWDDDDMAKYEPKLRKKFWTLEMDELRSGLIFKDKKHLQDAVTYYHVMKNKEFSVGETSQKVWSIKCKHECGWRLRAILKKSHGMFEIMQYDGRHTCFYKHTALGHENLVSSVIYKHTTLDHGNLDSTIISSFILGQVKEDPELKMSTIVALVKDFLGFTISYRKAWLVRSKAIETLFGDWDESYRKLPKFMLALQTFNPGTIVEWSHVSTAQPGYSIFHRVFWAFKPSLVGWRYCRPVVTIDSTYLYGKYSGKILIAIGITPSNKCYPLAFAVVHQENYHAWAWFISMLKCHIVQHRREVTLIADSHTAIQSAVRDSWLDQPNEPVRYYRYCLRHLCNNFNTEFRNQQLKDLVWKAGTASQVWKYDSIMADIEKLDHRAKRWLDQQPPQRWTRAHDSGKKRWGVMTTNYVEVFNICLKGARNVPITASVSIIFYKMVKYFDISRQEARKDSANGYQYVKHVVNKIQNSQAKSKTYKIHIFNRENAVFHVKNTKTLTGELVLHVVTLGIKPDCTCKKYKIFRYPCSHMVAVAAYRGVDVLHYIAPEYRMWNLLEAWKWPFYSPIHEAYWPKPDFSILIPDQNKLRVEKCGQPKSTRIQNETDMSQKTMANRSDLCSQIGHVKRMCPFPPRHTPN